MDENELKMGGNWSFQYPFILHKNSEFFAKRQRNKFIIPLQDDQERDKEQIPDSGVLI